MIERESTPTLTAENVIRLILFKHAYSLSEKQDLTLLEAKHWLFLQWFHQRRRSLEDMAAVIPKRDNYSK